MSCNSIHFKHHKILDVKCGIPVLVGKRNLRIFPITSADADHAIWGITFDSNRKSDNGKPFIRAKKIHRADKGVVLPTEGHKLDLSGRVGSDGQSVQVQISADEGQ